MITINKEICVGCAECTKFCPVHLITIVEKKAVFSEEKSSACINCGHCQGMCNFDAISIGNYKEKPQTASQGLDFSDLKNLIESNRSIRFFKDDLVKKSKIEEILRVLDYTASAKNEQPVKWIVVSGKENVEKLSDLSIKYIQDKGILPNLVQFIKTVRNPITVDAPHILIAYTNKRATKPYDDCMIKTTLASLLMHSDGIGSCFLGFLADFINNSADLRAHLELDETQTVYSVLGFGYNKDEVYKKIPSRKNADVTFFE